MEHLILSPDQELQMHSPLVSCVPYGSEGYYTSSKSQETLVQTGAINVISNVWMFNNLKSYYPHREKGQLVKTTDQWLYLFICIPK